MLDIIDALDLLRRCADRDGLDNLMSLGAGPGSDHPIAWTSGLVGGRNAAPPAVVSPVLTCPTQETAQATTLAAPEPDDRWPANPKCTLGAAAVLRAAEGEGRRGGTWAECLAAADVAILRYTDLLPDALRHVDGSTGDLAGAARSGR
jgi:hypothetical protein